MKKVTEEENIKFYKEYGISEWREKCLLLSDLTRQIIEDDLGQGVKSPLVSLAKLPFPHFMPAYLKTINKASTKLNDPALGYKMYLLEDTERRILFEFLKDPSLSRSEVCEILNLQNIQDISLTKISDYLNLTLEEILKLKSGSIRNLSVQKKWIYISQYIDAEEAKRLDLKGFQFLDQGEYKGCDLIGKLNLLNSAGREIFTEFLGLEGKFPKTSENLHFTRHSYWRNIFDYVSYVLSHLDRSVEEIKCIFKVKEESLVDGKTRIYENDAFKRLDKSLQMKNIEVFIMSDAEREVVGKLGLKKRQVYIARKYMFTSDEEVAEYLDIPLKDAKTVQL